MPKRRTHEEFVQLIAAINNNIEIIGRYINSQTKIKCRCKTDNYIWDALPQNLLRGEKCPICQNKKVLKGINDIATTNPEMIPYFKNIDDAYRYTAKSGKKVDFKCPKCGAIKNMSIYNMYTNGFVCPKCSDGISYPNKFSRYFLSQLPIKNIKYEYSPIWARPYYYDNYFEYNGKKYILEMDGGFHYRDVSFSQDKISYLKDTKSRDEKKNLLAKEHNIILIRINSIISDKEYLKKQIYNSILSDIFDLSIIDWDLCDKGAQSSLVNLICDDYKDNINYNTTILSKKYGLNITTIQRYLRIGNQLGLCSYTPTPHKRDHIIVKDINNNVIHTYYGIYECSRTLSEIYEVNFSSTSIIRHCENKTPYKNFFFERR